MLYCIVGFFYKRKVAGILCFIGSLQKFYLQDPHIPLTSYDLLSTSHGLAMSLIEVTVTLFTASFETISDLQTEMLHQSRVVAFSWNE